ncbi:hypothetical protein BJX66DRAFT_216841 [Aspergillus keveii]|uniref:Uncharacterized protein n=1 Tax=Aspergillus keveii TaxID=714993 RepID=A0ABR4G4G3_9EURO
MNEKRLFQLLHYRKVQLDQSSKPQVITYHRYRQFGSCDSHLKGHTCPCPVSRINPCIAQPHPLNLSSPCLELGHRIPVIWRPRREGARINPSTVFGATSHALTGHRSLGPGREQPRGLPLHFIPLGENHKRWVPCDYGNYSRETLPLSRPR